MIRIEYVSPSADIAITCNGSTGGVTALHAGRRYAEDEAETIVVNAGMLVYSCEDGSFVVLTTGTKKAVFDVSAPAVAPAPAEPVFAAPEAPAPEAPAV
jgi:hypothetical protein